MNLSNRTTKIWTLNLSDSEITVFYQVLRKALTEGIKSTDPGDKEIIETFIRQFETTE